MRSIFVDANIEAYMFAGGYLKQVFNSKPNFSL